MSIHDYSPEEVALITATVAKDATPDELKLFLYMCKALDLDPLKPGQIHFVKYNTGPGRIVIGIEGFRTQAARTGKHSGTSREVLRNDKGVCIGAKATVWRKDWDHPAVEEVAMHEYTTGRGPWAKMPETMIKKVAEAAALRMAFPEELGGLYTNEEMDQAKEALPAVVPEQPDVADGTPHVGYLIPFGKYKNRTLEQVGADELMDYVQYLERKAQQDGKQITGVVAEFIKEAEQFIGAFENAAVAALNDADIPEPGSFG